MLAHFFTYFYVTRITSLIDSVGNTKVQGCVHVCVHVRALELFCTGSHM